MVPRRLNNLTSFRCRRSLESNRRPEFRSANQSLIIKSPNDFTLKLLGKSFQRRGHQDGARGVRLALSLVRKAQVLRIVENGAALFTTNHVAVASKSLVGDQADVLEFNVSTMGENGTENDLQHP